MVNIYVYGLDQFVVGDVSFELTKALAKLYEMSEDDINFVAPNDMVFHKGVEQTSWRVIVEVKAPEELEKLQVQAKEVIFHYLMEIAIHIEVTFFYYCRHDHFIQYNEAYPKYLEEHEHLEVEDEYEGEYVEGEGEDEIYTGDIFANVEELKNKHHEEDDECDDEECSCHHHHH